jgi:hypothetical protein
MPSESLSRRRLLSACSGTLAALAGCLSTGDTGPPGTASKSPSESGTGRPPGTAAGVTGTTVGDNGTTPATGTNPAPTADGPTVASLSVRDFFQYALSGTHPHVHRRADTQYVFVRVRSPAGPETVRRRLSLTLDGDPVDTADREPVPWLHDTVDVAFAVSKRRTYDRGELGYDGRPLRSLSPETIARLNDPPVFAVSALSVSPAALDAGERTTAIVRFTLADSGSGRGRFGASLKGNWVSGSNLVTATLDADTSREITARTTVVGEGSQARVRLDWGVDTWSTSIPVDDGTTTAAGTN